MNRLLLVGSSPPSERAFLRAVFHEVVAGDDEMKVLGLADLREVLNSPRRADLFIGVAVVPSAKSVVLRRGNLRSVVVPLSWFAPRPQGPRPDFADVAGIACGQTLRLGTFEAAAEAILFEFDEAFRRNEKKRRAALDSSWGGSLRRLRLQRSLARDQFPGLSAKTIARLERGGVKKPRGETLILIAKALGVTPEEIPTY